MTRSDDRAGVVPAQGTTPGSPRPGQAAPALGVRCATVSGVATAADPGPQARAGVREGRGTRAGGVKVNCFTPGTRISTPRGEVAIETLRPGDRVVTRDNGAQEIRWIGQKPLKGPPLRLDSRLQPVRIRAGALGPNLPESDLRVSPNHRVLLLGDHPALETAEAEVFVSAKHLVGTKGIAQDAADEATYLHFMCDRHEVVLSNGVWTESFQPSDAALAGVAERSREEIFELFPDLRTPSKPARLRPARVTAGAGAVKKVNL